MLHCDQDVSDNDVQYLLGTLVSVTRSCVDMWDYKTTDMN